MQSFFAYSVVGDAFNIQLVLLLPSPRYSWHCSGFEFAFDEHFQGKQGPVEHIHRGLLFIHDRHHLENGGYLCVKGGSRNGGDRVSFCCKLSAWLVVKYSEFFIFYYCVGKFWARPFNKEVSYNPSIGRWSACKCAAYVYGDTVNVFLLWWIVFHWTTFTIHFLQRNGGPVSSLGSLSLNGNVLQSPRREGLYGPHGKCNL
jgi:hypothetical protein